MSRPPLLAIAALSLSTIVVACASTGGSPAPSAPVPAASHSPAVPTASSAPSISQDMASPSVAADASLDELPTRIVLPDLDIDLPVVSGDLRIPGNPVDYPLCDVAQYLTTYPYPGRVGTTTWIYGHARDGMFLPLLRASETSDGAALIGQRADVYTEGGRRFSYRITEVLRHATDRSSASGVPADGRRLVLQTSEGPKGTVPKLQVVAELLTIKPATMKDSMPRANPRVCYIP